MKLPPTITTLATKIIRPLNRYKILIFVLFVAGLYAYLILQINQASNVQPSEDSQTVAAHRTPRVNPQLVQKLQQLQDNSVSVQALFNNARTNPFE